MMDLQWYDFVGFAGTFVILAAYFGLQVRKLNGNGALYSILNLLGAVGILVSVVYAKAMNWSVFTIELAWILISLYGIWNSAKTRFARRPVP
jgi:paired small multidrug resistance pump